ncbi:bacteriophage antitermination protein Q [Franconibacter helveticus]|uniref:bacteriophage antitermination protein Q n=1 Tax=Franconibacter helveticus TaxID=357240 RepID=UPI000DA11A9B|nr:bacteriophage antitermination protein Q [Franconibacter helveticus]
MTAQYLQFIREELKTATADLSGATKGQLVAFAENAQFTATARSRGRKKISDPATGRLVNPDGPPMSGSQSRAKGSSIALVTPVEFGTASWRRAVMSLEEHQKAWLLWSYSENIRFEYQVAITQWAWAEFKEQLGSRKVAGKTMERLKALIWLAAQEVKNEIHGSEGYQNKKLSALVGVSEPNWTQNYSEYWETMTGLFRSLDHRALWNVSRTRSQQKSTFSKQAVAKVN